MASLDSCKRRWRPVPSVPVEIDNSIKIEYDDCEPHENDDVTISFTIYTLDLQGQRSKEYNRYNRKLSDKSAGYYTIKVPTEGNFEIVVDVTNFTCQNWCCNECPQIVKDGLPVRGRLMWSGKTLTPVSSSNNPHLIKVRKVFCNCCS